MKNIEIRELTLEDICNAVDNGLYAALYELSEVPITLCVDKAKDIFYIRQHAGIRTLVATIDDYIVGTAAAIIEDKILDNGTKIAHIEDVCVNEKFQRTGIGRKLMEELIKICKDSGCYKMVLYCNEDKVPFYEKLGFYTMYGMRLDLY